MSKVLSIRSITCVLSNSIWRVKTVHLPVECCRSIQKKYPYEAQYTRNLVWSQKAKPDFDILT